MMRHWNSIVRKMAPVLGAGLLLQAGGCSVDLSAIGQGLLTSIATNLISSIVFGLFNVPLSGF
ncbi:MAG: hypothetical protein JSU86_16600 [Phycisphaerales bacterium]|nr:MAG: hypothetical protein JSU86_16600 [Phycisphaerales bacterium]